MTTTTKPDGRLAWRAPAAAIIERCRRRSREKLRRALCNAWRSGRRRNVASWCRRSVRLDPALEGRSTRLDYRLRPWWRRVLELVADPDVRTIAVKASTQIGKTLQLLALLLYFAEHDPAPMMVVLPDRDSAIEFRDRLYADAAATIAAGETTRLAIPKPWRWNNRFADLGSCRIYLAWAKARQRLRGRPCRRVFLSEVDVFEGSKLAGDPVAQSQQRTKAFTRFLHYAESSPTVEPSRIEQLEQQADERLRWHATCPICQHAQELRFFRPKDGPRAGRGGIAGYTDEGGELVDAPTARSRAHYVCEKGCRIDENRRLEFITRGEWVGIRSRAADAPTPRSYGLHLWSIHSEAQTFGDLAASYVEAKEAGKLRDWMGNTLGIAAKSAERVPEWLDVGRRLAADNPRGCVPADAWFLTAGMDVQGDRSGVRYVVRAWGPGRTSWLVDWGWIDPPPASESGGIVRGDLVIGGAEVLERSFPIHRGAANPLGLTSLTTRLLCCDSNHDPRAVHAWLRSLPEEWVIGEGSERVRAIRGDGQLGGVRFQRSVVERNSRDGSEYDGGLVVWRLAVAELYPEFCERLFGAAGRPGSWHVTADAVTLGKSYLQQICNFTRRVVIDRHGRKAIEWGPRSRQIPVDFFDCEIYAEYAAEMVVGSLGWSVEDWKRSLEGGNAADGERQTRPATTENLSDR